MRKISTILMFTCLTNIAQAHDIGAYVYSQRVHVNQPTYITSLHHAVLYNNTDIEQKYSISFELTVDNSFNAIPYREVVTLKPHSSSKFERRLTIYHVFNLPSTHTAIAYSRVTGDGGENHQFSGTITVWQ